MRFAAHVQRKSASTRRLWRGRNHGRVWQWTAPPNHRSDRSTTAITRRKVSAPQKFFDAAWRAHCMRAHDPFAETALTHAGLVSMHEFMWRGLLSSGTLRCFGRIPLAFFTLISAWSRRAAAKLVSRRTYSLCTA